MECNTAINLLTRHSLGARGIDVVSTTTSSGNTVSYPLYDAHGNNVGALAKSGSSFTVSNEKSYDAWGGLRSGTNANGKAAYCANLGHKQDDESGLIYMRARYYEPTSGRFMSEDVAKAGFNWYAYCSLNPISFADFTGKNPLVAIGIFFGLIGAVIALAVTSAQLWGSDSTPAQKSIKLLSAAVTGFAAGFSSVFGPWASLAGNAVSCGLNTLIGEWVDRGFAGIRWGKVGAAMGIGAALGLAFGAVGASAGANARYTMEILGESAEIGVGDVAGGLAGNACGDAFSSGLYP
jgi:RHS repeat-associated protein